MDSRFIIGQNKYFARARVHAFEKLQELFVIAMVFVISFSAALCATVDDSAFLRGKDSRIHSIAIHHNVENSTRQKMHVLDNCEKVKVQATAVALMGSDGSALIPHIKSARGVVVLEGLRTPRDPKALDTELLSSYKNYPTSIPGEIEKGSNARYPLAVTIAATLAGQGSLAIHKGDSLTIRADGQLYTFRLPDMTIPSEGVLRLYAGTDDTLYYDSVLKHPVHAGLCKSGRVNAH